MSIKCIMVPDDLQFELGVPVCSHCDQTQSLDGKYRCMSCSAPAEGRPTIVRIPRSASMNEIIAIKRIFEKNL